MLSYSQSRPDESIKSMIDNSRWQSITINRLISEIDDQSMAKKLCFLIGIDWYQLSSITIDCHRLSSNFLEGQKEMLCRRNTVKCNYLTYLWGK